MRTRIDDRRCSNTGETGDGIPKHRQHAVERQPDEGWQESDAPETKRRQRGHHDREQREAGNGLNHAGHTEHRTLETTAAGDRDAERNAHRGSGQQREQRQLQVRCQVPGQERELLFHEGLAARRPSTSSACRNR